MISRGSSWSRPALVMVLYLGLGAAALGWTTLRGQSTLWQLPGRSDRSQMRVDSSFCSPTSRSMLLVRGLRDILRRVRSAGTAIAERRLPCPPGGFL